MQIHRYIQSQLIKKETMNLEESRDRYMGVLGGRKWKGNVVIKIQSKINAKIIHILCMGISIFKFIKIVIAFNVLVIEINFFQKSIIKDKVY